MADRAAYIAAWRETAIASGITFMGAAIATDGGSQARIAAAALEASLNPAARFRWHASGEVLELSAAEMLALHSAVRAHVQACFDHAEALVNDPSATVEAGWPT